MILSTQQLCIEINNQSICQSLNLTINPGEVWGILGPNGCGKSSLLHTLAGLITPTAGDVLLDSKCLQNWTRKKWAQQIAILLQDQHYLFSQSIYDFCASARYPHLSYFQKLSQTDHEIIMDALEKMQLDQFKMRDIQKLSGGEKKRLQIAALLTQAPQVYLLDEPSNHLDLNHQHTTFKLFHQLAKSQFKSIVMALHDINLAQAFCDYVLLMFSNCEYIAGPTKTILTKQNLQKLYKCALQKVRHDNIALWWFDA